MSIFDALEKWTGKKGRKLRRRKRKGIAELRPSDARLFSLIAIGRLMSSKDGTSSSNRRDVDFLLFVLCFAKLASQAPSLRYKKARDEDTEMYRCKAPISGLAALQSA
ncbi:hypothetical protein N7462_008787 [Penicillium macrosclerotiorum]|uniref:uncharacterized protein n=1 Tax=Penicillium macrosclerotiorum TaxID=303699 RepID=UPI0025487A47|nr:uncharacterized protein N7462_008787 [Penicillium macrosclerotiorum]KAJ5675890.1 hypothetical protein N7462_008787 [Penicillium macrosclerotiorum]